MITTKEKDSVFKDGALSKYQPPRNIAEFTSDVQSDYHTGYIIQNEPYEEFNRKSVLQKQDENQKRFNTYIEPDTGDPDEDWRYKGKRGLGRAKIIGMAAQATASVLAPHVFAQNDEDETDEEAAEIMQSILKWNIENTDYEITNVFGVIAALVNPCSYIGVSFEEAVQEIKMKMEDGSMTTKEVIDETISGMNYHSIPIDEILIANAYEYHHQKQRFRIRRRFIDITEAKALYGDNDNYDFVEEGVKAIYNSDDGQFYDDYDEDNPSLVEETTIIYRNRDIEVPFINGIYMGDECDDSEDPRDKNMVKHRRLTRDVDGQPIEIPVYPEAKFGFEPIDTKRFYYYKSAIDKMGTDLDLMDRMWSLTMDGKTLDIMRPQIISGSSAQLDSSVMYPAAVTSFEEDIRVTDLRAGNANAGMDSINLLEQSIEQNSQSGIREGQVPQGAGTAFEISRIEQNARINFSLFGKMLKQAITEVGQLSLDLILRHQTVASIQETLTGEQRLKFRTFIVPDEEDAGNTVTKIIRFSERLIGREMTEDQINEREKALFKEAGELDGDKVIIEVNPYKFADLRFMATISVDDMLPRNEAFEKALNLQAYDRMISNPLVNAKEVTRDFLVESFAKGNTDKYMLDEQLTDLVGSPPSEVPQQTAQQGNNLVEQIVGDNSLNSLIRQ